MVGHDDKQKAMFNSVISFMQEETALVLRVQARFRVVGVKDLFDVLDEDNSGSISYKEFKRGLARQKIYLSSAELTKVYRVADPDSSGTITLAELEGFMNYNQRTRVAAARSRISRMMMKFKMHRSITRGFSRLKINPALSSSKGGKSRIERVLRSNLMHPRAPIRWHCIARWLETEDTSGQLASSRQHIPRRG